MVPLWVVLLALAVAVSVFLFWRNPLPFPDRGHRCFAVRDEHAAKTVITILDEIGGLPERFTFDPGPTHQTLLWDNTTVIIHHDAIVQSEGFEPNAISVVVRNPVYSAQRAGEMLKRSGFTATVRANLMPEVGDKFVLLSSNAFDGWVMAFRCHILKMGKPPNKRRLLG